MDLADRSEASYEVLGKILDIGSAEGNLWLKLRWDSVPDERYFTWSKVKDVFDGVPDMVIAFLQEKGKRGLKIISSQQLEYSVINTQALYF